jgi:hypothetical protein
VAGKIVKRSVTIGLSEEDWEVLEVFMFLERNHGNRRRSVLVSQVMADFARSSAKNPSVASLVAKRKAANAEFQRSRPHLRLVD